MIIAAGLLAALYLLFAGQIGATEAIAGAPAILLAVLYAVALRRTASRPLDLGAPWGRLLGAVARSIVFDTARVAVVLLRGGRGAPDAQPFHAGAAADGGRRALVTLALSLAPNGFVTRIGPDRLIVHRLAEQPPSRDRDWPV